MHSPSSLAHRHAQKQLIAGIPLTDTQLSRAVNVLAYPMGLVGLGSAIPQAYAIWILGMTEGVSLITWATWTLLSLFWITYARAHKAHALVFINTCWFFVHGLVTVGIIVNR